MNVVNDQLDYWNNHSRYSIMKLSKYKYLTKSRNDIQIDAISSEI